MEASELEVSTTKEKTPSDDKQRQIEPVGPGFQVELSSSELDFVKCERIWVIELNDVDPRNSITT